jgi:ketosteroid isomerase-like protein
MNGVSVSPNPQTEEVGIARELFGSLSSGDVEAFASKLHPDVVFQCPFYTSVPDVQGRDALRHMFVQVHTLFSRVHYEVVDAFSAQDPSRVIVECFGDNVAATTGAAYQNHYVILLRIHDGVVVEWREFSNPLVYQQAMGTHTTATEE